MRVVRNGLPTLESAPGPAYSNTRRMHTLRTASTTLVFDKRNSSWGNIAFDLHEPHAISEVRPVTVESWLRFSVRRSTSRTARQAGQCTQRKWWRALNAAAIVGAKSIGVRRARASFQAAINRSASSGIGGSRVLQRPPRPRGAVC